MRRSYSEEDKKVIVEEAIRIGNTSHVAKKHGINESTIRSWLKKQKYSQTNNSGKSFRKIEQENEKLKKLLGEKELELAIVKDLLGKK